MADVRNATPDEKTTKQLLSEFLVLAEQVHQAQQVGAVQLGLFTATSNRLLQAVKVGYGVADEKALAFLKQNVQFFSAAKTMHQARELSGLLLDEAGQRKPWREFRKEALQLHDQYNVRWLSAEYEHAVASSQMASRWQDYDPDTVLQYETVGDSRVRPEHLAWDNIKLPASHPWWQTHYPPNGWLCRCTVIAASPTDRPTPASILPALPEPDPLFRGNVGQTGTIFPTEHPYFSTLDAGEQDKVIRFTKDLPDGQ